MTYEQALEWGVCRCSGRKCTELDAYKRLLYVEVDCDQYGPVKRIIEILDLFFLAAFTVELVFKILARGFIMHRHAYLRELENWLDFVVVVSGFITEIANAIGSDDLQNVAIFNVLRLVRVFRPLRSPLHAFALYFIPTFKFLVIF